MTTDDDSAREARELVMGWTSLRYKGGDFDFVREFDRRRWQLEASLTDALRTKNATIAALKEELDCMTGERDGVRFAAQRIKEDNASLQAQLAEARKEVQCADAVPNPLCCERCNRTHPHGCLLPLRQSLALAETRAAGYRAALENVKLLLVNRGYLEMHSYVTDALTADPGLVLTKLNKVSAEWASLWILAGAVREFLDNEKMHNEIGIKSLESVFALTAGTLLAKHNLPQ